MLFIFILHKCYGARVRAQSQHSDTLVAEQAMHFSLL